MFLLIRVFLVAKQKFNTTLHSTMFLLIPSLLPEVNTQGANFTFHNVSINTYSGHRRQIYTKCLYIPQCFY